MIIREAQKTDWTEIWPIFSEIVQAAQTYAFDPEVSQNQAEILWLQQPHKTFVAEEDGVILATYYIKANMAGPGGHVCNCGYMVSAAARGKGLATSMCQHSQKIALELGYKAMQFNSVASTNEAAVKLWLKLGYEVIGRLPKAFNHPKKGFVDSLVMYKWLAED